MEVGAKGLGGWSCQRLAQVVEHPLPTLPKSLRDEPARSDGGLWPISHSLREGGGGELTWGTQP